MWLPVLALFGFLCSEFGLRGVGFVWFLVGLLGGVAVAFVGFAYRSFWVRFWLAVGWCVSVGGMFVGFRFGWVRFWLATFDFLWFGII